MTAAYLSPAPLVEPITVGAFVATAHGFADAAGAYLWTLAYDTFSRKLGRFSPDKVAQEMRFVLDELGLPLDGSCLPEPERKRVRVALAAPVVVPAWAKTDPKAAPGRCRVLGHDHPAVMRGLCRPAYCKARSDGLLDVIALPAKTKAEAAKIRRKRRAAARLLLVPPPTAPVAPPPVVVRVAPAARPPVVIPAWAIVNPGAALGMCRLVGHDHPAACRGFCRSVYDRASKVAGLLDLIALPANRTGRPRPGSPRYAPRVKLAKPARRGPEPRAVVRPDEPLPAWAVLSRNPEPGVCAVVGCVRVHFCRDLCARHDDRARKTGIRDRVGRAALTHAEQAEHLHQKYQIDREIAIRAGVSVDRMREARRLVDVATKPLQRCSVCGNTGHNRVTCPARVRA